MIKSIAHLLPFNSRKQSEGDIIDKLGAVKFVSYVLLIYFQLLILTSLVLYFQVCISVQGDSGDCTATTEKIGTSLQDISCNFISAFQNLRKVSP